jgi:predicted ribosomally synthesized peptide with SipW-like signal peptide
MLRKFAGIMVVAGLSFGLIGAGVSATFTDNATATQQISIGSFGIRLASDSPGAVASTDGSSLTCQLLTVTSSAPLWPAANCHIQILNDGTIAPSSVKVYAHATVTGSVDLSHFMVQFNEGAGTWSPNMYGDTPMLSAFVTKTLVSTTSTVPADMDTNLGWQNLDNDDLNSTILVTYSIEASA